jgi:release factor glutamine methyltransferase
MATVLELLTLTTDYFTKKEIESPRLNAELLLSHVLECKRLDLYLWYDKPVGEKEVTAYREVVRQRGLHVPLQYITGTTEFYGMKFKVNAHTLIPRPETELLVEHVLSFAKNMNTASILDIGTGSGNIAIALARELPEVRVTAIDVSDDAIHMAKENAEAYAVENPVLFVQLDVASDGAQLPAMYDVIVSNPPYVSFDEYRKLQKEVVEYEPKHAVTDFGDGLKFYRIISKLASSALNARGLLIFEMGFGQAADIQAILISDGFTDIEIFKDYQGIERVVKGKKQ